MLILPPARAARRRARTLLVGAAAMAALAAAPAANAHPGHMHAPVQALDDPFSTITWKQFTASPVPRTEAQGATLFGRLYVFGGYESQNFRLYPRSDVYDPTTAAWTQLPDMPVATTHAGTTTDVGSDSVYFAGGYVPKTPAGGGQIFNTTNVWRFKVSSSNPTTGTWSKLPDLPEARGAGTLVRLDRVLHFFGGVGAPKRSDKNTHWTLSLNADGTAASAWTQDTPLPGPGSNHLGSAVLNGLIYAVAGQHGHIDTHTDDDVYCYNPASSSWTAVAPLPITLSHNAQSTFTLGSRILVLGGQSGTNGPTPNVYAYTPGAGPGCSQGSWSSLTPLPKKRTAAVAQPIDVGGTTYIFFTTGSLLRTTWRGTPGS